LDDNRRREHEGNEHHHRHRPRHIREHEARQHAPGDHAQHRARSTERRDLLDAAGKVIAFSQRAAQRTGAREGARLTVVDNNRNNTISYYAARRETIMEVLP
jgi:hypothetical protein